MEGNQFITVTSAVSGTTRYLNINHIVYYYRYRNRTYVILANGKEIECTESTEQIVKKINEVTAK